MKKLKILVIAPTPYYADRGCHRRIYKECELLSKKGYKITLLTYHIGRDEGNFEIIRIKGFKKYRKLSAGPSWGKILLDIEMLIKSFSIAHRYDIIHTHLHEGALIGIFLRYFKGKRFIFDYQGSLVEESLYHRFVSKDSFLYYFLKGIEKFIEYFSPLIITSSYGGYKSVKRNKNRNVFIVQDGIEDIKCFQKEKNKTFTFVYVGVFSKYQGVDDIIDVCKDLVKEGYKFRLIMIGYPQSKKYREIVQSYGIDAEIYDRMSIEEMKDILCKSHVGLSFKKSYTEGNGKLLLYMGANLPIITYNRSTDRYICKDSAIYVNSKNEMKEAMISLIANKNKYNDMIKKITNRKDSLSWEDSIKKIEELYYSLF